MPLMEVAELVLD